MHRLCLDDVGKVSSLDAELGRDEEDGAVLWAEISAYFVNGEGEEAVQSCIFLTESDPDPGGAEIMLRHIVVARAR